MVKDPIVEDVRSARRKIFEACNEDLDVLLDRLQEQEKQDQERVVSDTSGQTTRKAERTQRVRP